MFVAAWGGHDHPLLRARMGPDSLISAASSLEHQHVHLPHQSCESLRNGSSQGPFRAPSGWNAAYANPSRCYRLQQFNGVNMSLLRPKIFWGPGSVRRYIGAVLSSAFLTLALGVCARLLVEEISCNEATPVIVRSGFCLNSRAALEMPTSPRVFRASFYRALEFGDLGAPSREVLPLRSAAPTRRRSAALAGAIDQAAWH